MSKLTVTAAPHIHSGASTNRIMLDVIVALLPVTVASVVIFGLQSLVIIAACVISAVAAESLFDLATGKKNTIGDFSAVVTGLLLALNLSTNVPVCGGQCVCHRVREVLLRRSGLQLCQPCHRRPRLYAADLLPGGRRCQSHHRGRYHLCDTPGTAGQG